jgi:hypothetical protein
MDDAHLTQSLLCLGIIDLDSSGVCDFDAQLSEDRDMDPKITAV